MSWIYRRQQRENIRVYFFKTSVNRLFTSSAAAPDIGRCVSTFHTIDGRSLLSWVQQVRHEAVGQELPPRRLPDARRAAPPRDALQVLHEAVPAREPAHLAPVYAVHELQESTRLRPEQLPAMASALGSPWHAAVRPPDDARPLQRPLWWTALEQGRVLRTAVSEEVLLRVLQEVLGEAM